MKSRILSLGLLLTFATAALPVAVSAQVWPWNYNANNGARQSGVISSTQGSSFTLSNGQTVFMHQGTVINPTGTTLAPGMRVNILGGYGGNNAINANEVDVTGSGQSYGYGQPYNYGQPYGYGNQNGQWQAQAEHDRWVREQQRLQAERDRAAREQWDRNHAQQNWQNRNGAAATDRTHNDQRRDDRNRDR